MLRLTLKRVEDTSVSTAPLQFSWSDLDSSQGDEHEGAEGSEQMRSEGGEQTRSEVNAQVPRGVENVLPAVQTETVPEERTYRYLRHNPRFMYASVEDSPLQFRSLTSYFESPRPTAFSTKVTVGSSLNDAAEWVQAMKIEMTQVRDT